MDQQPIIMEEKADNASKMQVWETGRRGASCLTSK
jgi:hypothetical protein